MIGDEKDQAVIYISNVPGKLLDVVDLLETHKIENWWLRESRRGEFGPLRAPMDDPSKIGALMRDLKDRGFHVQTSKVHRIPSEDLKGASHP